MPADSEEGIGESPARKMLSQGDQPFLSGQQKKRCRLLFLSDALAERPAMKREYRGNSEERWPGPVSNVSPG